MNINKTLRFVFGGGALQCNVNKRNPLLNNVKRKLYVFLTIIYLSLSCFGEVPHSYVTDNPKTEVNKIETIKEREKAELNLSVTKKKSKELQGQIDEANKKIFLTLPEEFHNKSLVVVEGLEDLPNPSTVQGRKVLSRVLNDRPISNNITQEIQGEELIISYDIKPENLYISDLNGNFYIWKSQINFFNDILLRALHQTKGNAIIEIDDSYSGEWIQFMEKNNKLDILKQIKGINLLFSDNWAFKLLYKEYGTVNRFHINDHKINYEKVEKNVKYPNQKIKISQDLEIEFEANTNEYTRPRIKLIKYPKYDFILNYNLKVTQRNVGDGNDTALTETYIYNQIINFKYVIKTLEGQSVLTAKEYYPVNQFMEFNSTTMEAGSPLALENSLRDVSLTTTGKGIVTMQDGDKLEIDSKQVIVGAGGNLSEQKAIIGNLEYTYKVENGKLRLALNKWGVLEPDRNLMIRVWRTKDGTESKLVEHTLTIKSPRRVEGGSELSYNNEYPIRSFVRFNGISLNAPGISSLETPIPAGVTLSSQEGQGIPFMNEGDILEVNDGVTRAVHQFTIGANGTLAKKQIKFSNSDVTLYVENGKLRAGLNNWIVNKPVKLNLRLIRGTNEIMNHAIAFKVPEAPFNIKENGLLDFGRVTAGSKRTAETNIVLEMMKDVESVKFNLKDTQPTMENASGETLRVNEIQTLVSKRGNRTYVVKLQGKLTIPEDTQMGEYSGSTILELKIK